MKLLKWLDDYFEAIFMVILLFVMSIFIGLQVFMRYVMQNSLAWSEELSRYMYIYMLYLGISYGVRTNRHLRISVIQNLLKEKGQKVLSLFSDILFLFFSVIVVINSTDVAMSIANFGQITASTGMPMYIVYMGVPIGFSLVILRLLQNIIHKVMHFKAPVEDYMVRKMHKDTQGAEA